MKWAVDIESVALHAYRANLANVDDTAMYLGSINNYVQDAILGRYSDTVASPVGTTFKTATLLTGRMTSTLSAPAAHARVSRTRIRTRTRKGRSKIRLCLRLCVRLWTCSAHGMHCWRMLLAWPSHVSGLRVSCAMCSGRLCAASLVSGTSANSGHLTRGPTVIPRCAPVSSFASLHQASLCPLGHQGHTSTPSINAIRR